MSTRSHSLRMAAPSLALAFCVACTPTSPGDAPRAIEEDLPEIGTLVAYPPEPLHYTGRTSPFGKELLFDTEFNEIDIKLAEEGQAVLNVWQIERPHAQPGLVRKVADPDEKGDSILELALPPMTVSLRQRTSVLQRVSAGTWLLGRARCKASAVDELGLILSFLVSGEEVRVAEAHPGDDAWHDLEIAVPLPPGTDEGSFTLELVRRANSSRAVFLDNASLRMASAETLTPTPLGGGATELLTNGDFEHYSFLKIPYPWRAGVRMRVGASGSSPSIRIGSLGRNISTRILANIGTTRVRYQTESGEDNYALSIAGSSGTTETEILPGFVPVMRREGWIEASVRGKASNPGELALIVSFMVGGKPVELAEGHPGDGEWHTLKVLLPYPKLASASRPEYRIVRRSNSKSQVLIDDASFRQFKRHPEATDSDLQKDTELVINGGFEHFSFFSKLPAPWWLHRWEGRTGTATRIEAVDGAEGDFALSITQGSVGIKQQIYGLTKSDVGATLVVTAKGMAAMPAQLFIGLRCVQKGREMANFIKSTSHPGDGTWREMRCELTLPVGSLPTQVIVDVYRGNKLAEAVYIDSISVHRIVP